MSEEETRVAHAVESLLAERGEVLVSFCTILSMDPEEISLLGDRLKSLVQLLTDYSALGHFEVFDLLSPLDKAANPGRLLNAIQQSTDQILTFTETYAGGASASQSVMQLSADLDRLGEKLAERFELEDRLIAASLS